jgi:hypothetical protein
VDEIIFPVHTCAKPEEMDAKERFQLLSDAGSAVQFRQIARTHSGWYFTLAVFVLLAAVFRLPSALGVGWLICCVALAFAGRFGMTRTKLESVYLLRAGVTVTVAVFSAYCSFRGIERVSVLFAVGAAILAASSLVGLSRYRAVRSTPPDFREQVENAFLKASRSDPSETPGLIALQRATGPQLLIPNEETQYEYRLLFDQDLAFLIGINSFLGIRYSPRIRFIVPSRTFHLDVVGESWGGKRSKVRLMLDNDLVHDTLEVTPEMLEKACQQVAQHSV